MTNLSAVLAALEDLKGPSPGGSYTARCPAHDDVSPSLSIRQGDGGKILLRCHAGCSFDAIKDALAARGVSLNGAPPSRPQAPNTTERTLETTHRYRDAAGTLVYEILRFREPSGKTFRARRPDGNGGQVWNLTGVQPVPYRLPELVEAVRTGRPIFVVEGEKCAEALATVGLVATCNHGGAGKWTSAHAAHLKGARRVVILPDHDEPGRKHAEQVARSLVGFASDVRVVPMPGLPAKGDVVDWFAQGHTRAELRALVRDTPTWIPAETGPVPADTRLPLTVLGDLLREPEEAVSWTVEGLLPSGGFSIIAGKPKAGKSTLARELSLRVARGEPFLDRGTQHGPVIYLALEEKRAEVRRHFDAMGADGSEAVHVFAAVAPVDALEQIRRSVEEIKPALLVVDPLFRLARVKDANAYAETTQALEPLLALARETGTHVLVIHHMRKGGTADAEGILGSVAIFGSVDTALVLRRGDHGRSLASDQRYGENLAETVLVFDKDARTTTLGGTREQQVIDDMRGAIMSFLNAQTDWVTEPLINEDVEGKTGPKRRALRELVRDGDLVRDGQGRKNDPFKYASRNACFLVPHTCREQGNKNPKSDLSIEPDNRNACSRQTEKDDQEDRAREQERSARQRHNRRRARPAF